ncbi:MAG: sensor histidine kinase [Duncaniella sp.]|uniref:sensor histidine kinase n=1 Tax=Duncaniella sp. TaxID=2518496 RepID=UPI0023CE33DA|nr:sensor histidine kinase [Duncaniella sp.]MDE6089418.1 sensor histidine kinase [Duncaniella sp.]
MRRLITLAIALTFAALGMWADSQSELNAHMKAYNSSMANKQYLPAAKSIAGAAKACADVHNYEGAFRLIGNFEKALSAAGVGVDSLPGARYMIERARYDTYRRFNSTESALKALNRMAAYAKKDGTKEIASDMLFYEAQHYYSTGQDAKGDICINRLVKEIEDGNDNAKTDKAFHDIIDRAVSARDAGLVNHAYEKYNQWTDSVEAANADTELAKVKKEYAASQDTIADKDGTIAARTGLIILFVTLFVISLAVLAIGVILYLRILSKNRKMKKSVEAANAQSAAKSAILHNMASQMRPTLERLDKSDPAVRNIQKYVERIGELSDVTNSDQQTGDSLSDVNLDSFCETIAAKVRPQLKPHAIITLNGTKGQAKINSEEVEKILSYLLENAAKYTPEGGKITLTYKKRGAKVHQFIVTDSGPGIPEAEREDLFTPFSSQCDLAEGDRLGLPICALRAEKINGSLELDPSVASGTSFILTIHS